MKLFNQLHIKIIILLFLVITKTAYSEVNNSKSIEEYIKHAETFYWFGLAEKGSMSCYGEGLNYLVKAESVLKSSSLNENTKIKYQSLIDNLKIDLDNQIDMAHDTYGGLFPLKNLLTLPILLNSASLVTYELVDDPDIIAISSASEKLANEIFIRSKIPQLNVFFLDKEGKDNYENEVLYLFNTNSGYFVQNKKTIDSYLNPEELKELRTGNINIEIIEKLSEYSSSENILIVWISKSDVINDYYFFTLSGNVYQNRAVNPTYTASVMGFCRDKRDMQLPIILTNITLLLLSIIVFMLLFKKENPKTNYLSLLKYVHVPLIAFAFGKYFPYVIIAIMNHISPPSENLAILSFWWPILTGTLIILSPLFIFKVLSQRFNLLQQIKDPFIIFSATAFGTVGYFSSLFILFFEIKGILISFFLLCLVIFISFILARHFYQNKLIKNVMDLISPVLSAIILGTVIFLGNIQYMILAGFSILLLLSPRLISGNKVQKKKSTLAVNEAKSNPIDSPANLKEFEARIENPIYVKFSSFHKAELLIKKNKVIGIFGNSGRGKTSLLQKLLNDGSSEILYGNCPESFNEQTCKIPYAPFQKALSEKLNINLIQITKSCNQFDSVVNSLLDNVIPLSSIFIPPSSEEDNIISGKTEIHIAILDLLKKLSEECELFIGIDDVQWADDSSKELLLFLIDEIEKADLNIRLIIVSRTKEQLCELVNEDSITEVTELLPEDKVRLLEENLGLYRRVSNRIVNELGRDLSGKGELHWLTEMLKFLIKEGYFVKKDKGFDWSDKFNENNAFPVPENMRKIIEDYIDKFPEYEEVLLCAACIGKTFKISIVAESLEMSKLKLIKLLDLIETRTQLISDVKENDDFYTFNSSFVLEALRSKMSIKAKGPNDNTVSQLVREFHARIALSLEKTLSLSNQHLYDLALHFYAAGSTFADKGYKYCVKASQSAQGNYSYNTAKEYLQMAEECATIIGRKKEIAEECQVLELNILHLTGNITMIEKADFWIQVLEQNITSYSNRLLIKVLRLLYNTGNLTRKQVYFENAVLLAKQLLPSVSNTLEKAEIFQFLGLCLPRFNSNEIKDSFEKALELLDNKTGSIEAVKIQGRVYNSLAYLLINSIQDDQEDKSEIAYKAEDFYRKQLNIFEKYHLHDELGLAMANSGIGRCLMIKDDFAEAKYHFNINLRISKKINNRTGLIQMNSLIGECEFKLGNYANSLDSYQISFDYSEDIISKTFAITGLIKCAFKLQSKDKLDEYCNFIIDNLDSIQEMKFNYPKEKLLEAIMECSKKIEPDHFKKITTKLNVIITKE